MVIPGQLIFLYTIHLMEGAHTVPTPFFLFIFLAVALLQVSRSCLPGPGNSRYSQSGRERVSMGTERQEIKRKGREGCRLNSCFFPPLLGEDAVEQQ